MISSVLIYCAKHRLENKRNVNKLLPNRYLNIKTTLKNDYFWKMKLKYYQMDQSNPYFIVKIAVLRFHKLL